MLLEVRDVPHVVRLVEFDTVNVIHGRSGSCTSMLLSPRGSHLESGDSTALIARVAIDVGEGIQGCAARLVAHRDVTPHNILVHGKRGYLTDFSVAKVRCTLRRVNGCQQ